jgi:hypothetical protein
MQRLVIGLIIGFVVGNYPLTMGMEGFVLAACSLLTGLVLSNYYRKVKAAVRGFVFVRWGGYELRKVQPHEDKVEVLEHRRKAK